MRSSGHAKIALVGSGFFEGRKESYNYREFSPVGAAVSWAFFPDAKPVLEADLALIRSSAL